MQSGIAGREIGLGSRLGWVWVGRLASRWMKSLHHHHDGICEITQWNTMSSELCTMALLICCKLFCRHVKLADLCLFLGRVSEALKFQSSLLSLNRMILQRFWVERFEEQQDSSICHICLVAWLPSYHVWNKRLWVWARIFYYSKASFYAIIVSQKNVA